MHATINTHILQQVPNFKIGIITYEGITIRESPQMIKGRTQLYQENLFLEMQDTPVTKRAGIAEWRTLWKTFGADPNRYRHSAESLLRRVAKENYVTPIHSGVDINNFFSMNYEIPIGLYDADAIEGDIEVVIGQPEDEYEGLNGRLNNLKGIVHTKDARGSFGSAFVDSARTAVTQSTENAVQIFYLRPSLQREECQQLLEAAGKMFTQVNGGSYAIQLLP